MILFTGDCFLKTPDNSPSFSKGVEELFLKCEQVVINLETTVGIGGTKREKAHTFQSSPERLRQASESGVTVFNVANNHSFDYYEEGLDNTLSYIRENDKGIIGSESSPYVIVDSDKLKVGIIAYQNDTQPDILPLKEGRIINDIKQLAHLADKIVVCLHWGDEYVDYPSPYQQKLAHMVIDAGADLVIGNHPHVMQGIEYYQKGIICYSLGNFNLRVDHPYSDRLNTTRYAFCVSVTFSNDTDGCQINVLPIRINSSYQPELLNSGEKEEVLDFLNRISEPLKGKGISKWFYLVRVSPCLLHNYMPAWKMRVKTYGWTHIVPFIKWAINPHTWKYYVGYMCSLFVKKEVLRLDL